MTHPHAPSDLHRVGPQRTFTGAQLTEIAFPLGGLGTGTISLGGRGNLRDFEIFNRPAKGHLLPLTFFALWAKAPGQAPVAKILEGKVPPPFRSGHGEGRDQLYGVARFAEAVFRGEYPMATLELTDPDMPVTATLRAWNPFIPLNVPDSALPVAIFEWTFFNASDAPVEISLAASLSNPVTARKADGSYGSAGAVNTPRQSPGLQGIFLANPEADPDDPRTGTLALSTSWEAADLTPHWYRGGWWDGSHLFWDDFAADGRLGAVPETPPTREAGDIASLALPAVVPARGSVVIPVYIAWHFPRRDNPWRDSEGRLPAVLETYAGARFDDAWEVARYAVEGRDRLWEDTGRWQRAIFDSTLPDYLLEAITSQASIMRSPTCFLLADGSFFGWEGCGDHEGCCHGNCTHVWNYEQAVAFLFPELERSMRRTEFLHNVHESGNMAFRTLLPPGVSLWKMKPCVDGQMGAIIQAYRDWQLSGDDAFLQEVWPNLRRALEYAWTMTPDTLSTECCDMYPGRSIDSLWDLDRDGVIEGEQHNTYDIEFFGPNTLCTGMYLGALRAGEEIARYLGEEAAATEYRARYESGRRIVESELWNGDYYIQQVRVIPEVSVPEMLRSPGEPACNPTCACKAAPGEKAGALAPGDAAPKYQYGDGCLSDQLLGQWAAHMAGLGHLLDPAQVRTAVRAIFTHNFRDRLGDFSNVQRVYALNDEAGLLLCSWPRGNRPALPFVYSDEVWTGIEYQVAAHLIYEGWVEEGLTVVKAVTDRHAGHNRNPWNEVECGHHYARAMASWSVKLALDGFTCSVPDGRLGFAPKLNGDRYRTFWSSGTGWGRYEQQPAVGHFRLTVDAGYQTVRLLELADLPAGTARIFDGHGELEAFREGALLRLAAPVTLEEGGALDIRVE